MLSVTINDPRKVHLLLKGERKRITGGVKPLISSYGRMIQRDIIRSMLEPKHGQIYYRGNGRYHQASAAGEAPAKDTGALIDSIRVILRDAGWEAAVGSPQPYAIYLEEGTGTIRPRPAFRPSLDRYRKPFIESVRRIVENK